MRSYILISLLLIAASKALGDDKTNKMVRQLTDSAAACTSKGNWQEAKKLCFQAQKVIDKVDDPDLHISIYNSLAVANRQEGLNDSALYYYDKAIDTAMKLGDDDWIAALCANIAVFSHNLNHMEEAERYIDMANKHIEHTEDTMLYFCCQQLGASIKCELKKADEARRLVAKAWSIANLEGADDDMKLRCIPSLLATFDLLGKRDSVKHYISLGNRLLKTMGDSSGVTAIGYIQARAEMNYRFKRYRAVLADYSYLRRIGNNGSFNARYYVKIANCHFNLGNKDMAFRCMDTARMFTDSLAEKSMADRKAEFDVKYRTQEKELELSRMQQLHAKRQLQWTLVALGATLVIVVLGVVIIVTRHRNRMRLIRLRNEAELNEARQYIDGLEAERKRMAKELHDGVANELLGFSFKLREAATGDDLQTLVPAIEKIRQGVRSVSHGLMPPEFSRLDLNEILDAYIKGMHHDNGCSVVFDYHADSRWKQLPKTTAYEVFRIAQELIANAEKHAEATVIKVSLDTDGERCRLTVADNGKGIMLAADGGIGFRALDDRVKTIVGQLEKKEADKGTYCTLIFTFLA